MDKEKEVVEGAEVQIKGTEATTADVVDVADPHKHALKIVK